MYWDKAFVMAQGEAEGRLHLSKGQCLVKSLKATINLFIESYTILDFTRQLWVSHYWLCFHCYAARNGMATAANNLHCRLISQTNAFSIILYLFIQSTSNKVLFSTNV